MSELDRAREERLGAYASILAASTAIFGWSMVFMISRRRLDYDLQSAPTLTLISVGIAIAGAVIYAMPVAWFRFRRNQIRAFSLKRELDAAGRKLQMLIRLSSQLEEHMNYTFSTSINMDFALLDAEAVLRQIHCRPADDSLEKT
jgi:hypothetical protein